MESAWLSRDALSAPQLEAFLGVRPPPRPGRSGRSQARTSVARPQGIQEPPLQGPWTAPQGEPKGLQQLEDFERFATQPHQLSRLSLRACGGVLRGFPIGPPRFALWRSSSSPCWMCPLLRYYVCPNACGLFGGARSSILVGCRLRPIYIRCGTRSSGASSPSSGCPPSSSGLQSSLGVRRWFGRPPGPAECVGAFRFLCLLRRWRRMSVCPPATLLGW